MTKEDSEWKRYLGRKGLKKKFTLLDNCQNDFKKFHIQIKEQSVLL
jgi:hypothetical protein